MRGALDEQTAANPPEPDSSGGQFQRRQSLLDGRGPIGGEFLHHVPILVEVFRCVVVNPMQLEKTIKFISGRNAEHGSQLVRGDPLLAVGSES